jgi:membrane protein
MIDREALLERFRPARELLQRLLDEDAEPASHLAERWGGALLRASRNYVFDAGGTRAAAIAFYSLLSFFPFVVLLAAASTFLVGDSEEEVRLFVSQLRTFVPFLQEEFWEDVMGLVQRRGVLSLASLGVLFVVASRVSVATERALRAIFLAGQERDGALFSRFFNRVRAYSLTLFAILSIGLLFIARNLVAYLQSVDFRALDFVAPILEQEIVNGRLLPSLVIGLFAFMIYLRVPHVEVQKRWALLGAGVFVLGHEGAMLCYEFYAARLSQGDVLYGSFVGLVSLTIWVYWLSIVLIFAGEIVAECNGSRRTQPVVSDSPTKD